MSTVEHFSTEPGKSKLAAVLLSLDAKIRRKAPDSDCVGEAKANPGYLMIQIPAAALIASTLSVLSQVKSASSRPKWP